MWASPRKASATTVAPSPATRPAEGRSGRSIPQRYGVAPMFGGHPDDLLITL
jgi:hypothetical protein